MRFRPQSDRVFVMSQPAPRPEPDTVRSLVSFSLEILPSMFVESRGLFCHQRDRWGTNRGVSPRYSLICLIGLHRAAQAGLEVPFDLSQIYDRVIQEPAIDVADHGLRAWATALYSPESGPRMLDQLRTSLTSMPPQPLQGMQIGLALSGLVALGEISTVGDSAEPIATALRDRIISDYAGSRSGLFYHSPRGSLRRHLPNFATQVYLMHGLARHSGWTQEGTGARVAAACARALGRLQREDGGWPWIYSPRGITVEDYEIYSVHQDAMAPMAFHAIDDASGTSFHELATRGLDWVVGQNQMGLDMMDRINGLIYRSIRRTHGRDRLALGVNSTAAAIVGRSPFHASGGIEINATCRPYHPGWVLEAWAGRTHGRG